MPKFVVDIESTGLANHESIDYSKKGYPLKPNFKIHCIVAQEVESKRLFCFYDGDYIPVINKQTGEKTEYDKLDLEDFKRLLKSADSIIGHNIINYDLFILSKYWGLNYTVGESPDIPDTIDGRECFLDDTLIKSKMLKPDRFGGHSLENFGKLLNFHKGDFGKQENAWDRFTPEMLAYCIRDVQLNSLVHDYLNKEWGDWDWADAYCLEKATKELVTRSEQRGFNFNKDLAKWCVKDLQEKMTSIQSQVEPLLPRISLPKSKQPNFPSEPFKGNGEISSHGWNWLENHLGYDVNRLAFGLKAPPVKAFKGDGSLSSFGKKYLEKEGFSGSEEEAKAYINRKRLEVESEKPLPDDLMPQAIADLENRKMPDLTKAMTLADQKDLKEYLVSLGWEPSVWSESDLTLDSKKRKLTQEKYNARVERYVDETLNSNFRDFRCDFLKCTPSTLKQKLLSHDIRKPLKKYGSPKFTVDQEKTIDPSLLSLGNSVAWVKDVVLWLTYRHRKNAIYSPPTENKKETTGWLANPRLSVDGRIPTPADTCGAASARFTHIDVANIPRVSSTYGEYMRGLFGVTKDHLQIGMDFDSLEAKVESHFCWEFDPTKEYCESLIKEKPHDVHTVTSKKIGTDRDTAKSAKYCLAYGGQPPTLAKTIGKPLNEAQIIFNLYWMAAEPLARVREKYTNFWKTEGKRSYIIGIDGRKLFTRSEHSIVNLLFQNCGAVCAKRAAIWWDREITKEGLEDASLLIAYHDEIQMEDLKENVKMKSFASKSEAESWKASFEQKSGKVASDVGKIDAANGELFYVGYSRVGELASLSCKHASDYYNLNIDLSGGYMLGTSWATCH